MSSADIERLGLDEQSQLGALKSVLPIPSASSAEPRRYERHEVLRAIHSLLEALAADQPIVLALDDLHWADPASIDLLCRLLHRGIAHPALLLLALRPGQAEARLRAALWEAERHGLVSWIELQPLSSAESEVLLQAVGSRDQRALIFRESGGNPLYLEQLAVTAELQVGAPSEADQMPDNGVPAPVSAAIRYEAAALSASTRCLLEGAAVAGDPFEQTLAAHAADIEGAQALAALDELVESGLIRPTDAPGRFRFRHPIVRRAVYSGTGAGWRLGAHGRVAAALEERGSPVSARASHVERSAEPGDRAAIAVLTEAGNQTMGHAPVSAARWFEAATRLISADDSNLEERLRLAGQRATALGVAGRMEESLVALDEFLALSPTRPSELRLQAAMFGAIFNELLGRQSRGRRILREELARVPDQDGPAAADLKRELAFTYFFDADWAAMADSARQALAGESEEMVRVGALSALALGEFGRHNLGDVREAVSAAATLFDALTDEEAARRHPGIAGWLGWAEVCSERCDDAIRHIERGMALCRRVGQRHQLVGLLFVKSQALALSGRVAELDADAKTATEASLLTSSNLLLSWAMTSRCQASLLTGELNDAVKFGERGAAASAAAGMPLSGIARVQLAEALFEVAEPERCRRELTSADGRPDLPPFPLYEARCFELLARAELALGDDAAAEWYTKRAESSAGRMDLMLPRAHAGRARAALLLHRGDADGAVAVALDSAEAAARANAPIEAARGRILAGRGAGGGRSPVRSHRRARVRPRGADRLPGRLLRRPGRARAATAGPRGRAPRRAGRPSARPQRARARRDRALGGRADEPRDRRRARPQRAHRGPARLADLREAQRQVARRGRQRVRARHPGEELRSGAPAAEARRG